MLEGPIGAASALKMSYGGISKGLVFVASVMLLAAGRAGIGDPLAAELSFSDPRLLEALSRRIPDMLPKAHRWVGEMEEIARFAETDPAAAALYRAAAAFYRRIAADESAAGTESKMLEGFFPRRSPPP